MKAKPSGRAGEEVVCRVARRGGWTRPAASASRTKGSSEGVSDPGFVHLHVIVLLLLEGALTIGKLAELAKPTASPRSR